tara:strand:- start:177 stop:641 length:465 start_codon:yes stop_codon:yes gene_type:complete
MKDIEKNIITEWNNKFPKSRLIQSSFEYERFDAHNDKCIVELKYRSSWYDKMIIEFDKYSYNSWFAHMVDKKFFYVVAYKNKIVVFNITELNKYKYNYGWEYRVMPKQTEFCLDNKIVKFVGYLDYNKLKDSDFVYEFNAENNLNTTKSLFAHK